MIDGLKPYPKMKESGVPWLGAVPQHWEVRKVREVAHVINGFPFEAGRFSQSTGYPLIRIRDLNKARTATRYDGQFVESARVNPGDVLIGMDGDFNVGTWRGAEPALLNQRMCCIRSTEPATERLLAYLLPRPLKQINDVTWSTTVKHLASGQVERIQFGLPPLPEQAAIVRFLGHADRRIRRYVRAKQKLIKLLEEQKQAIIHRAVTRGLVPNVRLKPSGVEWLGEVPEHWEVLPLKRWVSTKITDGPHETPDWLDDGVPFLSAEAMVDGRLDFRRRRGFISRELHDVYCRKCRPQRDDIFMCKSGATTGKVVIVDTDDEFSVWSPLALIRVRSSRVLPRLLFALLTSQYIQRQVQDTWSYGTQPNLSMGALGRLLVALPPISEQASLLAFIDDQSQRPTAAISRVEREIELLHEYRTRLISDVVTGKLDVREAAARLPDEVEEPEPLDEIEAEGETDEASADDTDAVPEEVEA